MRCDVTKYDIFVAVSYEWMTPIRSLSGLRDRILDVRI